MVHYAETPLNMTCLSFNTKYNKVAIAAVLQSISDKIVPKKGNV